MQISGSPSTVVSDLDLLPWVEVQALKALPNTHSYSNSAILFPLLLPANPDPDSHQESDVSAYSAFIFPSDIRTQNFLRKAVSSILLFCMTQMAMSIMLSPGLSKGAQLIRG